jgi:hypothetical protein
MLLTWYLGAAAVAPAVRSDGPSVRTCSSTSPSSCAARREGWQGVARGRARATRLGRSRVAHGGAAKLARPAPGVGGRQAGRWRGVERRKARRADAQDARVAPAPGGLDARMARQRLPRRTARAAAARRRVGLRGRDAPARASVVCVQRGRRAAATRRGRQHARTRSKSTQQSHGAPRRLAWCGACARQAARSAWSTSLLDCVRSRG